MTEEGSDRSEAPLSDLIERLERRSAGGEAAPEEPPDAPEEATGDSEGESWTWGDSASAEASEPAPGADLDEGEPVPDDRGEETTEGAASEDEAAEAPLSGLVERLEGRASGVEPAAGAPERETEAEEAETGDAWEFTEPAEAAGAATGGTPSTTGRRKALLRGVFPAYPSKEALFVHGALTGAALLSALAVFLAVGLGLLPRQFWLLSLPFLVVGLFGLVPVLAYQLGVWDPHQLE